ncbi:DUF732 domain-containing protein [Rhodococcus koreensis]|uniref:DUF732 domain-containing protein n=1 Tax=Rhodococcus koreensis TaxID=99653 RepID=UPI0036DE798F
MYPFRHTARTAVLVAALLGASGLGAAVADAQTPPTSEQDTKFLSQMQGEGITFPSTEQAIGLGHHICTEFGGGATFDSVFTEGREQSDLDDYHVGYVIGGAVAIYCPQFVDELPG